jgi:predicted transposase/invertase (TIGR01784 family)
LFDQQYALQAARREGRKEGRAEGKLEGKEEGIIIGKRETARRLIRKGMDDQFIREITGLDLEEISSLRTEDSQ